MENPLLEYNFNTFAETPPFERIQTEHFVPALEKWIDQARTELEAITNQEDAPTFENTVEALEKSGKNVGRVASIFFNLHGANTNDEMQKLAQEISPKLTAWQNEVVMNEKLFQRIHQVHENPKDTWDAERRELLRRTYLGFKKNGALLNDADKEQLKSINQRLAEISLKFAQNVLTVTQNYTLNITDEQDLSGLPEDVVSEAKEVAVQKGMEGWVFTLQAPSYLAFMKFADKRELREKLYKANAAKAFEGDEYDNTANVRELVKLRAERAKLLGYDSFADMVLEDRMAGSTEAVMDFLEDLRNHAADKAIEELKELQELAKADGVEEIQSWDHAYYAEKLKSKLFALDDEILKPYFPIESVLKGAFDIVEKLFGLRFVETYEINVYHPDVKSFLVKNENDELTGILYTDFYPRDGKRNGAWKTSYRDNYYDGDDKQIPLISIVCNFTKPTETKPALLTFNEVTTLFHELGHAIHALLADNKYSSLAGTNVLWDFVELPSQFFENYCYTDRGLKMISSHYKTGESLPAELVEKLRDFKQFLQGYQTLRQLGFALLDMHYHTGGLSQDEDIEAFESKVLSTVRLYPHTPKTAISPAFSHIFQGGYAAGYYSYKWAEVLDADAFAYFEEKDIFDQDTAQKYRTLLSSGGTVLPMELYENFRGRKPTSQALLKRAGLMKNLNQ
ncbi:MAG: M3 family metallopeptidase [Weeksellaceae bacterium]|nr:M3 family metallopeptidase [Weeksellaceae bacterium]